MKFLETIPFGIKKLFFFYFLVGTFGIFFVMQFFVTANRVSHIWDDFTSLGRLPVKEDFNPLEDWKSQIISPSEVVTSEMVSKIRTPNLNSAPRKRKVSIQEEPVVWAVESLNWNELPRYKFRLQASLAQATRMRRLLEKVIVSPKLHNKVTPIAVEIVDDRLEPRGRMTMDSVSLVVSIPSESESLRVFVHELWHIIDIHYFNENVFWNDQSDSFYTISWKDHQTKKPGQSYENFVSGYAMTNKYEDFAESFSEYVFANEYFRATAQNNPILQKKYDFFKKYLFQDEEFIGTDFEVTERKSYIWDTTKMTIAVNKYLYYIK
jgi:Putative zinc-binding metallo-peptidase